VPGRLVTFAVDGPKLPEVLAAQARNPAWRP
jgi:hypothetical protein